MEKENTRTCYNNEAFVNDLEEIERNIAENIEIINEPDCNYDEEKQDDLSSDEEHDENLEKVSKIAFVVLSFRLKVKALRKKVLILSNWFCNFNYDNFFIL